MSWHEPEVDGAMDTEGASGVAVGMSEPVSMIYHEIECRRKGCSSMIRCGSRAEAELKAVGDGWRRVSAEGFECGGHPRTGRSKAEWKPSGDGSGKAGTGVGWRDFQKESEVRGLSIGTRIRKTHSFLDAVLHDRQVFVDDRLTECADLRGEEALEFLQLHDVRRVVRVACRVPARSREEILNRHVQTR